MSVEEIQRICPACRGSCNCKVCMRGDNLLKVFIYVARRASRDVFCGFV